MSHPLQSSTPIARQPAFIVPPGGASGHVAGARIPSTAQAEKNSLIFGCRIASHQYVLGCAANLHSFIQKVGAVEGSMVPNDDTQSHVGPRQSSLSLSGGTSLSFNASSSVTLSYIVWVNSWYVAKETVIRDGSTHGDVGAPLTLALQQWPSAP